MVELEECPKCGKRKTHAEVCGCDYDDMPYHKLPYEQRRQRERSMSYD